LTISHSISNWNLALPYAATVLVPMTFYLFSENQLIWNGNRLACVVSLGIVLVFTMFPSRTYFGPPLPSFERLRALPNDSRFAGLYASEGFTAQVAERLSQVTPQIRNQKTLWLCYAGPQLAYEGKSVRAVALPFFDTYSARSEETLMAGWRANPPDFVMFGSFPRPAGTKLFDEAFLTAWLSEEFEFVYEERLTQISLWRHKTIRKTDE
jgi:hypothetical protein